MKPQELSGSPKSALYDGSNLGRKLSAFSRISNFGFHLAGPVTEKWGSLDLQRLLLISRCLGCRVPTWKWASFHIRQRLWRSQLAWRPGENTRQLLWSLVFKARVKAPGCSLLPGDPSSEGPRDCPGSSAHALCASQRQSFLCLPCRCQGLHSLNHRYSN